MATKATDPVCGMTVEESPTTPRISYQGRTYLFCSTPARRDSPQTRTDTRRTSEAEPAKWTVIGMDVQRAAPFKSGSACAGAGS
ncbi:hypothetical protein GCM10018777_10950 [Streptomyces albogriseolus]|uniref:YHS domain-containing protein n=1 Tax=Streptomyces albogriseolus TaxID=1887 RepID=UPI0016791CEB|nr:YHS domain-containing protein [Streptomyces viridodiastaticus]MCX4570663.1 YHS domain-containing protein [Streptomyces viridodiastaticus]GHG02041.1 hypothetical protein GCM10018777_10950 [Streptomyces viridodiastaticus]